MRIRTNLTTIRKILKTFTNANNVFDQIIQTSQAKLKIVKKKNKNERTKTIIRFYCCTLNLRNFDCTIRNSRVYLKILQKINECFRKTIILKISMFLKVLMLDETKINFNVKIQITKKSKKNKFINKLININCKINKFTKKKRRTFIYESKYIKNFFF